MPQLSEIIVVVSVIIYCHLIIDIRKKKLDGSLESVIQKYNNFKALFRLNEWFNENKQKTNKQQFLWPWCYECVTWLRCFSRKIVISEQSRRKEKLTNKWRREKTEQRMKESAGNCLVLLWRSLVLARMPPRIKTTSRCVQRKCPLLCPSPGLCTGLPTTPWVKLCFTASCLSGMCQGFSFRGNRMQSFRTIV